MSRHSYRKIPSKKRVQAAVKKTSIAAAVKALYKISQGGGQFYRKCLAEDCALYGLQMPKKRYKRPPGQKANNPPRSFDLQNDPVLLDLSARELANYRFHCPECGSSLARHKNQICSNCWAVVTFNPGPSALTPFLPVYHITVQPKTKKE